MYTINHMWVSNMDGIIPEGRSKVYGAECIKKVLED